MLRNTGDTPPLSKTDFPRTHKPLGKFPAFSNMKKICSCGAVVRKIPCDKCKPKQSGKRKDCYDHQWRLLSETIRALNPLCHDCEERGRVEPSTEVHHIIPIEDRPDLRLEQSNLVALCHSCHRERHRQLRFEGFN